MKHVRFNLLCSLILTAVVPSVPSFPVTGFSVPILSNNDDDDSGEAITFLEDNFEVVEESDDEPSVREASSVSGLASIVRKGRKIVWEDEGSFKSQDSRRNGLNELWTRDEDLKTFPSHGSKLVPTSLISMRFGSGGPLPPSSSPPPPTRRRMDRTPSKKSDIMFPDLDTTTTKKYIRQITTTTQRGQDVADIEDSSSRSDTKEDKEEERSSSSPSPNGLHGGGSRSRYNRRPILIPSSTPSPPSPSPPLFQLSDLFETHNDSSAESSSSPSPSPEVVVEDPDFTDMTPDQMIDWARENLSPSQISNLLEVLEDEDESPSLISNSNTSIQYNSFITVPGRKRCPEGERMNHRGICTPKYVHNHNQKSEGMMDKLLDKMGQSDTRIKLMTLLRSLSPKKVVIEEVTSPPKQEEPLSTTPPPPSEEIIMIVDR